MLGILNVELLLEEVEHVFLLLNSVPPSHQEIDHEVEHKFVEASKYVIVEEDLTNRFKSPLVGLHVLDESFLEFGLILPFFELLEQANSFVHNIKEHQH